MHNLSVTQPQALKCDVSYYKSLKTIMCDPHEVHETVGQRRADKSFAHAQLLARIHDDGNVRHYTNGRDADSSFVIFASFLLPFFSIEKEEKFKKK